MGLPLRWRDLPTEVVRHLRFQQYMVLVNSQHQASSQAKWGLEYAAIEMDARETWRRIWIRLTLLALKRRILLASPSITFPSLSWLQTLANAWEVVTRHSINKQFLSLISCWYQKKTKFFIWKVHVHCLLKIHWTLKVQSVETLHSEKLRINIQSFAESQQKGELTRQQILTTKENFTTAVLPGCGTLRLWRVWRNDFIFDSARPCLFSISFNTCIPKF